MVIIKIRKSALTTKQDKNESALTTKQEKKELALKLKQEKKELALKLKQEKQEKKDSVLKSKQENKDEKCSKSDKEIYRETPCCSLKNLRATTSIPNDSACSLPRFL